MSVTHKQSTKTRHLPMRRCVLCRSSKTQSELIRFYKTETGNWELDNHHLTKLNLQAKSSKKLVKPSGRGAWVCLEPSCHTSKKLAYFFKKQATDIENLLKSYTNKHESIGTDLSKETENTIFHSGGMNV